jgi:hypothetical protein
MAAMARPSPTLCDREPPRQIAEDLGEHDDHRAGLHVAPLGPLLAPQLPNMFGSCPNGER